MNIPQAGKPVRVRNHLGFAKQIQLGEWMDRNKDAAETFTISKLAQMAELELEFTVTQPNIDFLIEQKKIVRKKSVRITPVTRAEEARRTSSTLASAIIEIFTVLGHPSPTLGSLMQIAGVGNEKKNGEAQQGLLAS